MPSYAGPSAARTGDVAGTLRLLAYLTVALTLVVLDHRGGWLSQWRRQATAKSSSPLAKPEPTVGAAIDPTLVQPADKLLMRGVMAPVTATGRLLAKGTKPTDRPGRRPLIRNALLPMWCCTQLQHHSNVESTGCRAPEPQMDSEWNDSQPIYRQIRDRVVAMILDGLLKEGDPLPSVRNVAAETRVNPLTVLKAYEQLTNEGLVEKRRGLGMFINEGARSLLLQGERQRFLTEQWPELFATIQRLGLKLDELMAAAKPQAAR